MTRPLGSRYSLGDVIGRGGMGEVYAGADPDGREFAFKVLQPGLAADPKVVTGFLQERSILTGLDHPGLVRVHDLVAEGETLAIVMDRVHGSDLRSHLEDAGSLPPAEVARIGASLAESLGVVHAAGIAHGDVKPENVLLDHETQPPTPRLTDFGIARILESSQRTRSTMLVGTPQYVAPELIDGSPVSPKADLYATGVVLYELACGVTPFAGGTTMAVLRRHLDAEPGRPEGIPDDLWDVITWCTAKSPGERPPSAGHVATVLHGLADRVAGLPAAAALSAPPAVGAATVPTAGAAGGAPDDTALTAVASTEGEGPRPAEEHGRSGRRRPLAAILAAALVVLVGAGAGAYALTRPDEPGTDRNTATAAEPGADGSDGPVEETSSPTPSPTEEPSGPFVMPDLVGSTLSQAEPQIRDDVEVNQVDQLDESATDGEILAQQPAAGTEVDGAVTLTVARQPALVYLDQLEPSAETTGSWAEPGTYEISGEKFTHSIGYEVYCDMTPESVEYTLSRDFRRFVMTAGIDDGSSDSSAKMQLEVFGDGRKLASNPVPYGEQVPFDVDVTDVLRLKVVWSELELSDECNANDVVLGDARLLGVPGEVELPDEDAGW